MKCYIQLDLQHFFEVVIMKKVIVAMLLTFAMIFVGGQINQAEANTASVINIRTFLSLREEPNTYSRELARIPNGAYVEIIHPDGSLGPIVNNGFYLIKYNGITGWAHSNYISYER